MPEEEEEGKEGGGVVYRGCGNRGSISFILFVFYSPMFISVGEGNIKKIPAVAGTYRIPQDPNPPPFLFFSLFLSCHSRFL